MAATAKTIQPTTLFQRLKFIFFFTVIFKTHSLARGRLRRGRSSMPCRYIPGKGNKLTPNFRHYFRHRAILQIYSYICDRCNLFARAASNIRPQCARTACRQRRGRRRYRPAGNGHFDKPHTDKPMNTNSNLPTSILGGRSATLFRSNTLSYGRLFGLFSSCK